MLFLSFVDVKFSTIALIVHRASLRMHIMGKTFHESHWFESSLMWVFHQQGFTIFFKKNNFVRK